MKDHGVKEACDLLRQGQVPPWGQRVAVVTPHFQFRGLLDPGGEWHRTDGSAIENVSHGIC